jgi:teichuronic acid biosynthesis glycosyltransferase TuaC
MIQTLTPAVFYGLGSSLTKFFELLILPVLLFYYSKSQIGQFSLLLSASVLIIQLFSFSINNSIVKNTKLSRDFQKYTLKSSLFATLISSLIFLLVYFFLNKIDILNFNITKKVELYFILFCFIEILIQPFFAFYQVNRSPLKYFLVYLFIALTSVFLIIILTVKFKSGIESFFLSYSVGRIIILFYFIFTFKKEIFVSFKKKIFKILVLDGFKFLPGIILLILFNYNVRFILEIIEGTKNTGIFYVAQILGMVFALPVYGMIAYWKIIISKKNNFILIGNNKISLKFFSYFVFFLFIFLNLIFIAFLPLLFSIFNLTEIDSIINSIIYISLFYLFFLYSNLNEISNYKKNKITLISLSYLVSFIFQIVSAPTLIKLYSYNGASLVLLLSITFHFLFLQILNSTYLKVKINYKLNIIALSYLCLILLLVYNGYFLKLILHYSNYLIVFLIFILFSIEYIFKKLNEFNNTIYANNELDNKILFIGHGNGNIINSIHTKNLLFPFLKKGNIFCGFEKKNIFKNFLFLAFIINSYKINTVVSCYGSWISFLSIFLRYRRKLVLTFCGDDLNGSPKKNLYWSIRSGFTIFLSNFSTLFAHNVIVKSSSLKSKLYFNMIKKKAIVLPNGVDLKIAKPINDLKTYKIKRKLSGHSKNDFLIIFNKSSGLNQYSKNYDLAKNIIKILNKKYKNVKLLSFSNLDYFNFIDRLSYSDLLLVTSKQEGSPNIVKEAMACNIPIISSNCGDVNERIKDTNYSYLLKNFDVNKFVNKIEYLIKIKNSKLMIRSNGREQLKKQKLEAEQVYKKMVEIFKKK